MSFTYDTPGVEMNTGGYEPLPAGKYVAQIEFAEEGITKNGDNKVTVDYKVIDGPFTGKTIRFHTVSFLGLGEDGKAKKGAGIALHYLKSIGEPYQVPFEVDARNWIGKKLVITLGQEKDSLVKLRNNVRFVNPLETAIVGDDSQVPF